MRRWVCLLLALLFLPGAARGEEISAEALADAEAQVEDLCPAAEVEDWAGDAPGELTFDLAGGVATVEVNDAEAPAILPPEEGWATSGTRLTLTATLPGDCDAGSVRWESDGEDVIRVDPCTGAVTALRDGEAVISLRVADGTGEERRCSLRLRVETGFEWIAANGQVTITGWTASGNAPRVPAYINGEPVTMIGDGAFQGKDIVRVDLPATLRAIGRRAFQGCKSLTEIESYG